MENFIFYAVLVWSRFFLKLDSSFLSIFLKWFKSYELFSSAKLIRLLKLFKLNQVKTSKETSKQTSNDKTKQGKRN